MNLHFPGLLVLNLAENACHTRYNLCPLRGARTRDALARAKYLDEALDGFVPGADALVLQHHWPVWNEPGRPQRIAEHVAGRSITASDARNDFASGEYRWVVEVLNHVVFAEPRHREVRQLCADAMEQLGYQAESRLGAMSTLLAPRNCARLTRGQLRFDGPLNVLQQFVDALDEFDPAFNVVEP
jgi:alkyl sulfatase BDS1-like metallo-beta-lactamase superfamily hydrolase